MNVKVHSVPLAVRQPDGTIVKRGALSLFRTVRALATHSKEVPGIVERVITDIRDAWEESSRPNA